MVRLCHDKVLDGLWLNRRHNLAVVWREVLVWKTKSKGERHKGRETRVSFLETTLLHQVAMQTHGAPILHTFSCTSLMT